MTIIFTFQSTSTEPHTGLFTCFAPRPFYWKMVNRDIPSSIWVNRVLSPIMPTFCLCVRLHENTLVFNGCTSALNYLHGIKSENWTSAKRKKLNPSYDRCTLTYPYWALYFNVWKIALGLKTYVCFLLPTMFLGNGPHPRLFKKT